MDLRLMQMVTETMPKMNMDILNGLADVQLQQAPQYINDIMRCAAQSFPKGVKYIDGKFCTPLEQFTEISRSGKPMRMFEMTRSDIYLMKYLFSYNGTPLRPAYVFLPFIDEADLLYLKGTQYMLTPVISGKLFNIENGNIYMPTPRAKMGFSSRQVSCILNNKIVNTTCVSTLLINMEKTERSVLRPTLVHYLLAEAGLTNMLRDRFNLATKIGNAELDNLDDNWYVYRSRQIPSIVKRYQGDGVTIRIAIPKESHTPIIDSIIGSIFYILDNAPDSTRDVADLDNPMLWVQIMDRFIFKMIGADKRHFEKIEAHMENIKSYIDPITRRILESEGIFCSDIFALMQYICINYQDIQTHYDVGTMYGKELGTVKHVLSNIVYSIFTAMWKMQKLPENMVTIDKLNKIMATTLSKNTIFSTIGHGELTPASIATDCKPFGATANIISHNKASATGKSKGSRKSTNNAALLLHASQVEVGTYSWITNSDPTGRSKMNPFLYFSRGNLIAPRNELRDKIDNLRELLPKRI